MELRTKRELIAGVAEVHKRRHYSARSGWYKYTCYDPKLTYDLLLALPENATEEQVIAIVGNRDTENICSECRQDVEATVMLGEELDYESDTAWICPECLRKALEFVTADSG